MRRALCTAVSKKVLGVPSETSFPFRSAVPASRVVTHGFAGLAISGQTPVNQRHYRKLWACCGSSARFTEKPIHPPFFLERQLQNWSQNLPIQQIWGCHQWWARVLEKSWWNNRSSVTHMSMASTDESQIKCQEITEDAFFGNFCKKACFLIFL